MTPRREQSNPGRAPLRYIVVTNVFDSVLDRL